MPTDTWAMSMPLLAIVEWLDFNFDIQEREREREVAENCAIKKASK